MPILPKFTEAAAFLQSSLVANSGIHPFYLTAPSMLNSTGHPISPYSMPNIGHLLEQLQGASPHRPPILDTMETNPDDLKSRESNMPVIKQEQAEELTKSHSSSCSDLVMDEDVDNQNESTKEEKSESTHHSGDLEAVKRILETVNATVTKQLLQANMQKFSDNSSDCQSILSAHSPSSTAHTEYTCITCKRIFISQTNLEEHECEQNEVKSEGLAAKLEDALTTKSEENHTGDSVSGADDDVDFDKHTDRCDDYEMDGGESTDQLSEDGRKVRVRSLISEEQLKVLKDNYTLNPRPKREELIKIAEKIGFQVRVVQVWFQNTRARDRREGRLIQVPFNAPPTLRYPPSSIVPSTSPYLTHKNMYPLTPSPQYTLEQPLDLSFKKESISHESSPATSPRRPSSVQHYDSAEDIVNLSQKSSRSPTPFQHIPYPTYHQNSNSSEPHRSPSPLDFNNGSRLAQILAQPTHKLGLPAMGFVPMDRLMQLGPSDLPSLTQLISNKISSLSPNSEKRVWGENGDHEGHLEEDLNNVKRNKISQLTMKSLGSPTLSNQEGEIEGQYSCDQCDKAFSKQSSLARHKYEHSGEYILIFLLNFTYAK